MPNLYKTIPDCQHLGCDEAGIYFLIPSGRSYCAKHAEEHQEMYEIPPATNPRSWGSKQCPGDTRYKVAIDSPIFGRPKTKRTQDA